MVSGTGDTDNASFTISGSSLRITNSPDFETKNSYRVRVRTTDQEGLTYEEVFVIDINNINEAPTDIALSASSINENVAANSIVGTLFSTDADAGNLFTYTLVAGTGDTDNASFNISGNSLRITASPDFETKSSYAIRIRTTDQGGLPFEKQFTVTINNLCDIALTTVAQINVSYYGGSNGSATVSASGGTGFYYYYWSPSGGSTATATGLAAGTYMVIVTDANACTTTRSFTITQPPVALSAAIGGGSTAVSCYGGSNGTATVAPTGGTAPYIYLWSNGATTATATGLAAGSYTVTVTDANGCKATRNYTITQSSALSFTTTTLPGYDYNSLYNQTISVAGGTGGKSYAVTTGSLPSGFTLSSSGVITGTSTQVGDSNFTVTVTDANSCTAAYNFVLKLNQIPITVTATASQVKVYGQSDPVLVYTVTPSLLSGDSFTGTLTRVTGENIGNYAIHAGTLSAGSKYLMTFVSKDFAITAKPITVSATASQAKVYGTVNPVYTYSVSPSLVSGDSFTGVLTRAAGENVGTYAIAQGSLSAGSNYTISYVSKDFAVTAKPIAVSATASQTKVYGTADPVFAYTVSPALVGSDTFTGALTRTAGQNVGTYAIAQGSLSAGANYTITYVGKDFTITKANQTITCNQNLELGCNGVTTAVLTATSSSGLAVSYTSSNTNIATISNSLIVFNNYGFATITASQAGNTNYNATPVVVLPVVNSQPNLIRKQFEDIIFFDNSSMTFASYSWYKNGVLVPSQTAQYFKENGALNGTYYATATRLDGMVVTTCPLVLSPTVEEEYIKIVPNPAKPNTAYELVTNVSSSRLQNARVEVYSVGGLLMESKATSEKTVTLKAPIAEGIYIVKMTLANGKYFTKNLLVKN